MVLCESMSDFPPNLVRIFKRGLDSQQSRVLTACCFNIADNSHLSKSEMHAWTSLNCLNFWTDWQWIENTRKSGSCAFKFTSGVSWGLSFPSDHTFNCELRVHHQVRPQLFSLFLQKSQGNSENFGQKRALVHSKGFVNHFCKELHIH